MDRIIRYDTITISANVNTYLGNGGSVEAPLTVVIIHHTVTVILVTLQDAMFANVLEKTPGNYIVDNNPKRHIKVVF